MLCTLLPTDNSKHTRRAACTATSWLSKVIPSACNCEVKVSSGDAGCGTGGEGAAVSGGVGAGGATLSVDVGSGAALVVDVWSGATLVDVGCGAAWGGGTSAVLG